MLAAATRFQTQDGALLYEATTTTARAGDAGGSITRIGSITQIYKVGGFEICRPSEHTGYAGG